MAESGPARPTRRAAIPRHRAIRAAGVKGQAADTAHVFVHVPLPHRHSVPPAVQTSAVSTRGVEKSDDITVSSELLYGRVYW